MTVLKLLLWQINISVMQFLLLYIAIKATLGVEKFLSSAKLLFKAGMGKKKTKTKKKLTTTTSKKSQNHGQDSQWEKFFSQ